MTATIQTSAHEQEEERSEVGGAGCRVRSREALPEALKRCDDHRRVRSLCKPTAVPNPMWISTVAQFPEPRGALELDTQSGTRRKIFVCQFNKVGVVYVGYIGDESNAYGATVSGTKESASTYLTRVLKGIGPDAKPRYGWVNAGPDYTPHARSIAKVSLALNPCTSAATVNGPVRDLLFGFTSDRAACTDSIKATNTEGRPSYVWSAPTIVELPNPEANAG